MPTIFLFALFIAVLLLTLGLYLRNPSYWFQPILEQNIFRQLTFYNGHRSLARTTAILGLFTALTVIMASSALYLPIAGQFLSHFATLFVAGAMAISIRGGIWSLIASTLLLLWVAAKQVPILLLADGLLGLIIGWGIATGQSRWLTMVLASFTLAAGAAILTYLLGLPIFAGLTLGLGPSLVPLALMAYGIIYSWAWIILIADFLQLLKRLLS